MGEIHGLDITLDLDSRYLYLTLFTKVGYSVAFFVDFENYDKPLHSKN